MHGNASHSAAIADEQESATVLLVDDQPVIGMVVRKMLSVDAAISFHVCTQATHATEAIRRVRPTVILQDLAMPGADGLDLLMTYRSIPEARDIPIIVFSSNDDPAIKKAAFTMGANDYMVKLPEPIELVARIRYHSRSYMVMIQRDNAYRALRVSKQELLEKNVELRRLTNSDGLTGLANRRYFNEYIAQQWALAQQGGASLSLLMIDVDDFKSYNDRFGHLAGDAALQQVAAAIGAMQAGFGHGLAARFGGEEFTLVLPGLDAAEAHAIGERLRTQVEALGIDHPTPSGRWLTISIGIGAMTPGFESSPVPLIEAADARLYQAKCDGRNRTVAA